MSEAEASSEAESALAAIQNARRTLKDARARQHQVKLSRQYYKVTNKTSTASRPPRDDSHLTWLRCGKLGHRAANCLSGPASSQSDGQHSAPFVCFAEAGMEAALSTGQQGATKELASVWFRELHRGRVFVHGQAASTGWSPTRNASGAHPESWRRTSATECGSLEESWSDHRFSQ